METREIKNKQGECIGQLSFPEGTPEDKWEYALSAYIVPDPEPVETEAEVQATMWARFKEWFKS